MGYILLNTIILLYDQLFYLVINNFNAIWPWLVILFVVIYLLIPKEKKI